MTAPDAPVSLAVVNARVWTGTPRRPWADAVVVRGDRIAAVGGSAEARKLAAGAPSARVVDAARRTVVGASPDGRPAPDRALEPGGMADFVLLDRDLPRVTPEALAGADVVLTVAAGRVLGAVDAPQETE